MWLKPWFTPTLIFHLLYLTYSQSSKDWSLLRHWSSILTNISVKLLILRLPIQDLELLLNLNLRARSITCPMIHIRFLNYIMISFKISTLISLSIWGSLWLVLWLHPGGDPGWKLWLWSTLHWSLQHQLQVNQGLVSGKGLVALITKFFLFNIGQLL